MITHNVSTKSTRGHFVAISIAAATLVVSFTIHRTIHRNKRPASFAVNTPPVHRLHVPELTITKIIQHGHIVEIDAKVEPGTTVMVNGERAAVVWEDGEIKHFVGPLPDGVNDIAITVQTDEGGINSKQLSVAMP